MTATDTIAIVLAGGASSRFGLDKLAVSVGGRPLLHHALEAVAAVADRVVVVVAPEAPTPSSPAVLAGRVIFARDAAAFGGPLAGLAAGLAAVDAFPADEAPRITGARVGDEGIVLVVGGDMPSLAPAVLRLLVDGLAADPSLAAMTLGASPPAPLPMALRPGDARTVIDGILGSPSGRRSLRALLDGLPSAAIPAATWRSLDPEGSTLRDIDTPGDLGRG
jgi:molybdopterin-guanine dinucleotide biosynthesis protein A